MARWMVGQGARNIVLISRTGKVTDKVKKLVDDATAFEASIVVKQCDVSNAESVNNLIQSEMKNMPQIRGVVHGAMVLNVNALLFQLQRLSNIDRMSFSRK